jgi:hypothetical protein
MNAYFIRNGNGLRAAASNSASHSGGIAGRSSESLIGKFYPAGLASSTRNGTSPTLGVRDTLGGRF